MHAIEVIKLFLTNIFVHNLVRDFYHIDEQNVASLAALMHYASSIGTALACLLWAYIHDRYHSHKLIFRVGIFCGLVACFIIPTVPNVIVGILSAFFLNGLGSGIYLITFFELIKHCKPSSLIHELNILGIFFLIGDTLATIIGGTSTNTDLEFKLPYVILAGFLIISFLCGEIYCYLTEKKNQNHHHENDSFLLEVYHLLQGSDDIKGVHEFCLLICLYKAIDACLTFSILSVLDSPEAFDLQPLYKMLIFACLSITSIILKVTIITMIFKHTSSSIFTLIVASDIAVGLFFGFMSFNQYQLFLNWMFIVITVFCAAFSNTNAEMVASENMLRKVDNSMRLQMSVLIFISQLIGSAIGGVIVVFLLFLAENVFYHLKYVFLESEVFLFFIILFSVYVYKTTPKIYNLDLLHNNNNIHLPSF